MMVKDGGDVMARGRVNRRGQVLVEFAMALPLLVGLIFFLIEAGFFVYARQGVHVALREGSLALLDYRRAVPRQGTEPVQWASRASFVEDTMRIAMRRSGLTDIATEARFEIEEDGEETIVLEVSASYRGLTPLAVAFQGQSLRAQLRFSAERFFLREGGS